MDLYKNEEILLLHIKLFPFFMILKQQLTLNTHTNAHKKFILSLSSLLEGANMKNEFMQISNNPTEQQKMLCPTLNIKICF